MLRKIFVCCAPLSLCLSLVPTSEAQTSKAQTPKLTAEQVVEKNVAAVGGAQAWRGVHAMTWTGKMDAGPGDSMARSKRVSQSRVAPTAASAMATPDTSEEKQVQLPFTYNLARPNKSRLEIVFNGKTAVQIFDGTNGWKQRPYLNRNDVEAFTAEELKGESEQANLDGPLVDAAAKGNKIAMDGLEKVDGHEAYRLKVTLKDESVRHVWVDAQSFLELRREGQPRRMDGKMHHVYTDLKDYRKEQGVMVPHLLENTVEGYRDVHQVVIESVVINPKLDDAMFKKPQAK